MGESDWSDLFGAFFDKVDWSDEEKDEFVIDFYHMDKDERSDVVSEMLEVIVGECMEEFEMLVPNGIYLN